jgi:hypothetical protein
VDVEERQRGRELEHVAAEELKRGDVHAQVGHKGHVHRLLPACSCNKIYKLNEIRRKIK